MNEFKISEERRKQLEFKIQENGIANLFSELRVDLDSLRNEYYSCKYSRDYVRLCAGLNRTQLEIEFLKEKLIQLGDM